MPKRKQKQQRTVLLAPSEGRAVEALTAFWMLAVVMALVCEGALLAAFAYLHNHPDNERAGAIYFLLWLTAAVVGTMTLVLGPIVVKLRVQKPPRAVTIVASLIGVAPWIVLLVQTVAR